MLETMPCWFYLVISFPTSKGVRRGLVVDYKIFPDLLFFPSQLLLFLIELFNFNLYSIP